MTSPKNTDKLGMDSTAQDLKSKIESEIIQTDWTSIRPHADREAVILVSPELSLVDAGVKVVADDVKSVESWLEEKKLVKVTGDLIQDWDKTPDKQFNFVILQPFVLIQEQRH